MTAKSMSHELLSFLVSFSTTLKGIADVSYCGGWFYVGEVTVCWSDGVSREQIGAFRPKDGYEFTPEYKDLSR